MYVEDGEIKKIFDETEAGSIEKSGADNMLQYLKL